MNDATLLYVGMFCFGMTLLGLVLTYYEFKKMSDTAAKEVPRGVETKPVVVKAPSVAQAR